MEERKPMYEFDLGFMGKVICSADTAASLSWAISIVRDDALKRGMDKLSVAYYEVYNDIYNSLKSIGYFNDIL